MGTKDIRVTGDLNVNLLNEQQSFTSAKSPSTIPPLDVNGGINDGECEKTQILNDNKSN